jgi:type II secretory pathway component GspD/PulD (secretin)
VRASFEVTTDEPFFTNTRQSILGPTGGTIGFNDQIQVQQVSVGIVLDVVPQISADNVVLMNVRPAITSLTRTATFTGSDGSTVSVPVTDRREGDTFLRIRNGETAILGGLMQTQRNQETSGIPFLKDIPGLGKLFQHTTDVEKRVELVVFLTPTVISGQPGVGR